MSEKCPFCAALKSPYQPSPAFREYDCGTYKYGEADYTRKDTCYLSEIIDLETKIRDKDAELTRLRERLGEAVEFIKPFADSGPSTLIGGITRKDIAQAFLEKAKKEGV